MRNKARFEIDLSLLEKNLAQIRSFHPHANLLPMIKANAYGHGSSVLGEFLACEQEISFLGVASLQEGIYLAKNLPVKKYSIIVFSETCLDLAQGREAYLNYPLIPVISNLADLKIVLKESEFKHLPLYLKLNTGMNRLGLSEEDLVQGIELIKKQQRSIEHLMTHYACANQTLKKNDRTTKQYEKFLELKKMITDEGVDIHACSTANSAAIEQRVDSSSDFIRPGLMMYGPSGLGSRGQYKGKMIGSLWGEVDSVFAVKKGDPVGYGNYVMDKSGFISVLNLGYGDGILPQYSGAQLELEGHNAKIVGRINMDMTFLFTEKKVFSPMQSVALWGDQGKNLDTLTQTAKTHHYQAFCAISGRVPRKYRVG